MQRTVSSGISLYLHNEVKHDIIDYENQNEILLSRSGATLSDDKKFSSNFTGIKNYSENYFLYTWNIHLRELNNSMNIIMGNYNPVFGSGLVLGKKAFVSSDPFTRNFIVTSDRSFTPSENGNPVYSFNGAAAEIYHISDHLRISLLPFFSCQERFINQEDSDRGYIESSIATLNTKIHNPGEYEPVYILNYGVMTSADIYELFKIQACTFETDLKKADLNSLNWDSGKNGIESGIDKMRYSAIFLQYADKHISLFMEPAISEKYYEDKTEKGRAVIFGTAFKSRNFDISFLGKSTDNSFQADYSSGNRMPEKTWELKSSFKTGQWLKLGATVYSQNYLQGGYNSSHIEGTRREELSARSEAIRNLDIRLTAKSLSYSSDEYNKKKYQYIISISHKPLSLFNHSFKGMIQKYGNDQSELISQNFNFNFYSFIFSAGFSYIKVSGCNHIYSGIPPGTGSLSGMYRFSETGYGTAAMLKYRKEKNSFYFRWERTETEEKNRIKIESALTLLF